MITSAKQTIELYIAAWNTLGDEETKAAFAKCWAAGATYTDPNFALVEGVEGISALAVSSQEKFPGRTFSIVTPPQEHHQAALYTWGGIIPGLGELEGQDYIELDGEYKIARLVSFFKPL